MNRTLGMLSICGGLFALSCAPSLKDNPPREAKTETPDSFGPISGAEPSPEATHVANETWEQFFSDPKLKSLIGLALRNNRELNIQLQEVLVRHAEIGEKKGEVAPRLDAGAGVGVEKVGRDTSQGASDEAHGLPEPLGDFRFGLTASWEVDIWKKLRNATKAARLRYLSSLEGRKFMVTEIVAELANSYYELIALDNQLAILERNIDIQKDALEVVRLQKQAARVTELAVQRFEAEVLKNRSKKYDLEQKRVEAENKINFLVGRFPRRVSRNAEGLEELQVDTVSTGVPAALLENRPDVRAAELELEASKLDVKVARANFYPSLSIEAGVGYESFNAGHLLLTPESMLYNAAGNLTAPLLNRSAIKARYKAANARQIAAVLEYEQSILKAFTEVVSEMNRVKNLKKSYELEAQQVEVLRRSIGVSNVLFRNARADYMEVLLTRRDSLEAEMELIETKMEQLKASVGVYRALGGGWRTSEKDSKKKTQRR